MEIKAIVLDVEGTTTDINFVHKNLFPYAYEHMADFIVKHHTDYDMPQVLEKLSEVYLSEHHGKVCDHTDLVKMLRGWIDNDLKQPELKKIQGYIWNQAYQSGAIKGHLYDDVLPTFIKWKEQGKVIAVYSSGSVLAQKNLFQYSVKGDVTEHISQYFDTGVGMKQERQSYEKISHALNIPCPHILFLSDIWQELDAAQQAGYQVAQVVRPGTDAHNLFTQVATIDEMT